MRKDFEPTNKRRCYIAGPMRGIPEYNYPAFHDAAARLRANGWEVASPAEMDLAADNEDYAAHSLEDQKLHDTASAARRFAYRDTQCIINWLHAEHHDAIVVLPGWEASVGATAEVSVARWVMLPVLTLEEALDSTNGPQST